MKKKLLFKVYRDQARLSALKRDEKRANDCHSKAEKIIREELLPAYSLGETHDHSSASIKTAKL